MRKWFIFIILLLFNFVFMYGINQANLLMFDNNFMIYINPEDKPEETKEEEPINITEEEPVDINYNGESISQIAEKIDKYYKKTPLEGHGEYIAKNSVLKSVNPYLIAGIIIEGTSCKTECSVLFQECNNVSQTKGQPGCFGGTYKNYSNINDSISDLINKISNDFYTTEMQVPYKMYGSYGKNSAWAFKVTNHMDSIKRIK